MSTPTVGPTDNVLRQMVNTQHPIHTLNRYGILHNEQTIPTGKEDPLEPSAPSDEPQLCPEQAALVDIIMKGHNVFYTGSAGCGKSTVLKAFVKKLREADKNVRIVAPTGRAALNVGGTTTWTFAGWTPDSHKKPLEDLKRAAEWGKTARKRFRDTDVLVIDEVSMVEAHHLDRLNEVLKAGRYFDNGRNLPFGGCQVVVTGDFCQLPPVKPFDYCIHCGRELTEKINDEGNLVHVCKRHGAWADEDKWAFRSKAWEECNFVHVHLKTIHRQNDQMFIRMLQKCRLGERLTDPEVSLLLDHPCRTSQATKLFCTRKEADDVNRAAFDKIQADTHTYWAYDSFFQRSEHPHLRSKGEPKNWSRDWSAAGPKTRKPLRALETHRFSECVELKKGGLVVLLANLDLKNGLCNGSQGIVCGFEDYDPAKMPMPEHMRNRENFKPGQRALRGEHATLQEEQIKEFLASECMPIKKWPRVRFHNGVRRTIYGECSVSQLGDREPHSVLARTQIPLAPAWAMTIHKAQSLTLDRVIVNLDRAFEEGQIYVALSRATGLEGLKVEGDGKFLRNKMLVNSEVATFLREKFGDMYGVLDSEAASPASSF